MSIFNWYQQVQSPEYQQSTYYSLIVATPYLKYDILDVTVTRQVTVYKYIEINYGSIHHVLL